MSYRFMRVIIMFDLPTVTSADRKEYTKFHKYLIKNGFLMMQESIYCKLAQNASAAELIVNNIRNNKPMSGLVQSMIITEKQFGKIEYIVGERKNEVLDNDDRLVIL
ncbi:CRISPR-associated endoribonuclease Cas2 [uncultured Eubacterium sp.]|jgi:CRISPR-associated protein Cas2|nr:CRISPR-associated endoribonuclease Cas2 [uncultured Eubacterium sp.]